MARLSAGDYGATAAAGRRGRPIPFPGDSSWSTELRARTSSSVAAAVRRAGIQISADEVVVGASVEHDAVRARHRPPRHADGRAVYENRYVIWGHLAWGLLREYEVYEDTQKSGRSTTTCPRSSRPEGPIGAACHGSGGAPALGSEGTLARRPHRGEDRTGRVTDEGMRRCA